MLGISEGKRYKQIAYEMGLSEGSVKAYVWQIGKKIGAQGSLEICSWYWKNYGGR